MSRSEHGFMQHVIRVAALMENQRCCKSAMGVQVCPSSEKVERFAREMDFSVPNHDLVTEESGLCRYNGNIPGMMENILAFPGLYPCPGVSPGVKGLRSELSV
jgi:hypothetical protein